MARTPVVVVACLLFAFASESGATLIDRGGGLIYDDVLDITWLQDAGLGGLRTWEDALTWADTLVFGGFDDWRLPSMDVNGDMIIVNCEFPSELACRDNELGYMFYWNFGGMFGQNLTGDQGLIQNLFPLYWSSTEFSLTQAWFFGFSGGVQFFNGGKDLANTDAAWAVRDGDVIDARAPAPSTFILIASGVLGLAARRHNRGPER